MERVTTNDEAEAPVEPLALPKEPPVALIQDDGEIDLFSALLLIARNRRLVLKWALGGAILVFLASYLLPTYYTAVSRIMPPHPSQSVTTALLGPLVSDTNMPFDFGLRDPNEIYIAMLRSRSVEEALVQRFDLQKVYGKKRMSDALAKLDKHTLVDSAKSGVISIHYEDTSPERASAIANAYVETLQQVSQRLAVSEASQRRLFFEQQLKQAKDDLASAETALKEVQEQSGLIEMESQYKAVIQAISAVRGEIAAREVELQGMQTFATPDNPGLIRKRKELEAMRANLARLERSSSAQKYDLAAGKLPREGLEFVRRTRDVKYYETIFGIVAKQLEAAKIDESKTGTVIQVLDPAAVPDKRSRPFSRRYFALLGLIAGFALGMTQMLGREFLKSKPEQRSKLELLRATLLRHP